MATMISNEMPYNIVSSLELKVYGQIRGRLVTLVVNYDQSLDPLTDALAMKAFRLLRSTNLGKNYLEKGTVPQEVIELFARRVALPKPTPENAHRFKAYEKLLRQVFTKYYGIPTPAEPNKSPEKKEEKPQEPLKRGLPVNKPPLRKNQKRPKEELKVSQKQLKQLLKRLTNAHRREKARKALELKTLALETSIEKNIAFRLQSSY